MSENQSPEEWWHGLLTGANAKIPLRESRYLFSLLPGHARCKFCNSPFDGGFAPLMRMIGRGPSRLTSQFCLQCQIVATDHIGGIEIELTLLFADVRGSTRLGERMKPVEFSRLIGRFFSVSSQVLLNSRAWVDRLVGDQVIGIFIPYFVGSNPERAAINAAKALLHATGQGERDGPWIEVGVGIHSGTAFIGTVGSHDAATDITVLGDVPNVAARLSSAANSGEILISEDTHAKAGLPLDSEKRLLDLKGKSQPMAVCVLNPFAAHS
ncbi:MAG TPA: adenylate/guanylate cyclase domain-containing protein [Anaerolineaceae bacterium]|nr:adenylate/guanylate cyclase domain-containing protein [Anaerolineaceae bacterium]